MRIRKRLFVALLSAMMMIIMLPVIAHADSGTWTGKWSGQPVQYYVDGNYVYDSADVEGNKITLTDSAGNVIEYIAVTETYGDGDTYVSFYENGVPEGNSLYMRYYGDEYLVEEKDDDGNVIDEYVSIPEGTDSLNMIAEFYDEYNEEYVSCSVEVPAEAVPYISSLEYSGAPLYYDIGDYGLYGLYEEGNKITEKYSDGSSKDYIYTKYTDKDGDEIGSYLLNGEAVPDEYGNYYGLNFDVEEPENGYTEGTTEVTFSVTDYEYGRGRTAHGTLSVQEYPYLTGLTYEGIDLTFYPGSWGTEGFYTEGNKITETYSDGSTKVYICAKYTDSYGDEELDYFLNGEAVKDEEGYYETRWYKLDDDRNIPSGTKSITFSRTDYRGEKEIVVKGTVNLKEAPVPKSAVFSGKVGAGYIGQKYLYSNLISAAGNKITVTYTDGSTKTYICKKVKEGKYYYFNYYLDGDTSKGSNLWADAYIKKGLKKGANTVKFTINVYDDEEGRNTEVRMPVKVTAKKLYVEGVYKGYIYTGKVIKPKIVVKDGNGKTVPAKYYTVKYYNAKGKLVSKPWAKKYGTYDYRIVFKKAYAKKYMPDAWGYYGIVPKGTSITKITAGKGKFTVKWKKTSGIDGYYIEYSTSKSFNSYGMDSAAKSKTSATVTDLVKGKTYYVRVCTYKKQKQDGMIYHVRSNPSKVVKVKIK